MLLVFVRSGILEARTFSLAKWRKRTNLTAIDQHHISQYMESYHNIINLQNVGAINVSFPFLYFLRIHTPSVYIILYTLSHSFTFSDSLSLFHILQNLSTASKSSSVCLIIFVHPYTIVYRDFLLYSFSYTFYNLSTLFHILLLSSLHSLRPSCILPQSYYPIIPSQKLLQDFGHSPRTSNILTH